MESVRIAPGATAVTPLIFDHYPVSHSLVAVLCWGVALGAVYALTTRNTHGAFVIAALVVSHWLLNAIVHVADLPLSPGVGTMMGLGLWQSKVATIAVEVPIFALGVWLYVRSTRAKDKVGTYGLVGLVGFSRSSTSSTYSGTHHPTSPPWPGSASAVAAGGMGVLGGRASRYVALIAPPLHSIYSDKRRKQTPDYGAGP